VRDTFQPTLHVTTMKKLCYFLVLSATLVYCFQPVGSLQKGAPAVSCDFAAPTLLHDGNVDKYRFIANKQIVIAEQLIKEEVPSTDRLSGKGKQKVAKAVAKAYLRFLEQKEGVSPQVKTVLQKLVPAAVAEQMRTKVPASFLVGMALHNSDFGETALHHNYFGKHHNGRYKQYRSASDALHDFVLQQLGQQTFDTFFAMGSNGKQWGYHAQATDYWQGTGLQGFAPSILEMFELEMLDI